MTQWLIDTFVWTGALIVAVLLLRGTVARHFGPQVAYALWALPLLRMVLPPLVLPASFAPADALPAVAAAAPAPVAGEAALILASAYSPVTPTAAGIDWGLWLAFVWAGGALAFLLWRVFQYRTMRADLLADARPVGEHGKVRLIETPAVGAPVAFGVFDKVVALPPLFMASPDRAARDMAIAHELAHHRGHDLLANFAAQPLLALHWFNPLAWAGWRAMRRDQEAACDARVVAGCEMDERATYARVIASFATGRNMALAAPMACPVGGSFLGEKSIIHRLRSLTKADVSALRRKLGLAAIGASALVALPLTASVSYAQAEAPQPPAPPAAPLPPEAPLPPDAPGRVVSVERMVTEGDNGTHQHRVVIRRADGTTQVEEFSTDGDFDQAAIDAEVASAMAEAQAGMAEARAAMVEQQSAMVEHRAAMAENRRAMAEARETMPRVVKRCDGDEPVRHATDEQGREITIICRRAIQANAAAGAAMGLRQAQNAIRTAPGMPQDQRDRMIEDLQQQIDRMERGEISFYVAPVAPVAPLAPVAAPGAVQAMVAPVVFTMPVVRIEFKAAPAVGAEPVAYTPVALWLSGAALDKAFVYGGVTS